MDFLQIRSALGSLFAFSKKSEPASEPFSEGETPAPCALWDGQDSPSHQFVSVLHVALWTFDEALEKLTPDQGIEALNEFHNFGREIVEESGGAYERTSATSFTAFWVSETPESIGPAAALDCALKIRSDISRWNQLRKVDGYRPVAVVMGADLGKGLVYLRKDVFASNSAIRARALALFAPSLDTDLLLSDEIFTSVSSRYFCDPVGELGLGSVSVKGNIPCYRLLGYRDEQGRKVFVSAPIPVAGSHARPLIEEGIRWMVNNGSQIQGPLTPSEIAKMLYSQDLDFDSECWLEGKGDRTTISKSGMFGNSERESGANLWAFDGDTIHGPFTEGFLKTGHDRQVFSGDARVCVETTLSGWSTLDSWVLDQITLPELIVVKEGKKKVA